MKTIDEKGLATMRDWLKNKLPGYYHQVDISTLPIINGMRSQRFLIYEVDGTYENISVDGAPFNFKRYLIITAMSGSPQTLVNGVPVLVNYFPSSGVSLGYKEFQWYTSDNSTYLGVMDTLLPSTSQFKFSELHLRPRATVNS